YAPGADGRCARLSSSRWSASRAQGREPHQQALPPPTYLLVSPGSVGQDSLVTADPREVCRLSPRGDIARGLNLYPAHYRPAFACSLPPSPPSRGLALRLAVRGRQRPRGATGLPRFVAVPVWVRSRLSAGGATTAPEEFGASGPGHVPFGPSV